MIDYPANLPDPSTQLSGDAETPTFRTDIDNGLIEQFGRFATGTETLNLQWVFSQAELVVFEEWFAETLHGGALIFGLKLPDDGAYSIQPVRFVSGSYSVSHKEGLWWNASAKVERLLVSIAPANRTLPIPQWQRLSFDPATTQNLTLSHRNARMTVRPIVGAPTVFSIYPPVNDANYIYFGVNNQGAGETLITSIGVDPIPPEAVPSWPGTLPGVDKSFALDAKRAVTRVDMESGHSRQWAASETTVKGYKVEWTFTLAQLQTFQDFFWTTLKAGSLPFRLTLPVDGLFISVRVRFVDGKYSEDYVFHDTFKVTAKLDRIVDQTVTPSDERPYPMYYGPVVYVSDSHYKIKNGDGKFFVVNPPAGQTIWLHIGSTATPEFGLLVTGLGNVQITRTPFVVDIGSIGSDTGSSEFLKPAFQLKDTIYNIYPPVDETGVSFVKPAFEMKSVVKDIGDILGAAGNDSATSGFATPKIELIDVLVDIGDIPTDTAGSTFSKPIFELLIP